MPTAAMDLRLLTCLDALLDTCSVSGAADRMGISQPAMSRILARLRDQIGDPLMVRRGVGMVLTPRAEALAEPLKLWLAAGQAMMQAPVFDPATLERTFRIASTDFGVLSVLRPALAGIARSAPSVAYEVQALAADSLKSLADGRIDLVIVGFKSDYPGVRWRRLFTEHRLALCRRGHPALGKPMTEERFFAWPHVTPLIGDGFAEPLVKDGMDMSQRNILLSAPSFSSIPYLVAETDAFAVLPSRAARYFAPLHDLTVFDPPIDLPEFDYYVAWHERSDADLPTRWLAGELEKATAEKERPASTVVNLKAEASRRLHER